MMVKKKAKLIFKHNYFEIAEEGDHVLCAVSGKEIKLTNLDHFYHMRLKVVPKVKKINFSLSCL